MKKYMTWMVFGVLLVFILIASFVGSSFSLVTGHKPIATPKPEMDKLYNEISREWIRTIEYYDPKEKIEREGLIDEIVDQVTALDLHLSPGLLKALSVFRGRFSEKEARKFADILQPSDISVELYPRTIQTEVVKIAPNGELEESKVTSEFTHDVYRIKNLTDYQGYHKFKYEMIRKERIVEDIISGSGNRRVVKEVIIEPAMVGEELVEDYTPLYEAMKIAGLRGKMDMQILFRQALAFDPYFNDPKVLAILPDYGGITIGFTGRYSNGDYSLETNITEYSGVTVQEIQRMLEGTPMAGTAPAFMKAGKQYGIDPAFLVGIAGAEQSFKPFNNNAFGITGRGDAGTACVRTGACFAKYSTMEVGIFAAARLLSGPLYVKDGLVTIEDIWHRWAPGQASNDPNGLNENWATNVIDVMAKLRSQ